MNRNTLYQYSPGLHFNSRGEANIVVWSPHSERVEITLPEKGVNLPLEKAELGYWTALSDKIRPGDLYKVVLNSENEFPDPASRFQPEGVHGPSQAVDPSAFQWTDGNWENIDLADYIIYELHTGTFSPEGTFDGIESKLDYLRELGITAIEIMPVAQFPGTRNWGYDGVAPFAVQNSYGGPEGLMKLVNACHQKGLAVILDVVYNHMGPEGNYLSTSGPYFTDKYNTPWGNAVNFDDEYSDGVRQYFIENVLMWFRDFHIDALRMDAVHAIKDLGPVHILREMKMRTEELMKETGKTHYLIAEVDLNDTRYINPLEERGYGIDAQWVDEFHHALRVATGESRNGYYSDFNGIKDLAKSYTDAYVYDGQYSSHRKKFFGIKAENHPGQQFIVFSQNHDQVGNRMLGERTSQLLSFGMQKLVAASVIMSPYLPMLFMGEEWSEPHPFLYFVSHTDEELAESVRKGRKEEFAAFHANGEAPDPLLEDTFLQSKLQWDLLSREQHKTMFNYYKALIALRKENAVLSVPDRKNLEVTVDETAGTLILHRYKDEQHVLCLMNFSGTAQKITLPAALPEWHKLIHSADRQWGGDDEAAEKFTPGQEINLLPGSALILG